jgi:hypothetical protein
MHDRDRLVRGRGSLVVAALLASVTASHRAHACGGFFCNRPQNPDDLPVAQTGENVLFVMDRMSSGSYQLEAHIQIFYTGPADKFSWVVPVDGLPTLEAGSNRVFQVLEPATRPRFSLAVQDEGSCKGRGDASGFGCGAGSESKKDSSGVFPGAPGPNNEVQVVFKGDVGPYGAVVLRSEDAEKLKAWLAENQYFLSDKAGELIDVYVREQKFFVALKLLSGRGVNEIQPIVLKFEGAGPCVPLRLTAIASIADLQVNLWVLAKNRVVPENFLEIVVNEAKIDWLRSGQNYPALLKQAANEAGGNAFTVEYAGPTSMLSGRLVPPPGFNLARLRSVTTPPDALDEVARLGLPRDATMLGILRQFIPEPAELRERGVDETTFYNQLRLYWSSNPLIFAPFDPRAFADAIDAGLVQPLVKTQALFDNHPKLTRLATFISPEEMSVDPTFIENPSLPDVPAMRRAQGFRMCGDEKFSRCDAPLKVVTPAGRNVWFNPPEAGGWCAPPTTPYDRSAVDALPSMEVAWRRDALGEGAIAFDNRAAIANALGMHNAGVDDRGCACSLGGRNAATPILVVVAGFVLAFRRRLPGRRR